MNYLDRSQLCWLDDEQWQAASSRLAALLQSRLADYGIVSQACQPFRAGTENNPYFVRVSFGGVPSDVVHICWQPQPMRDRATLWTVWVDSVYPAGMGFQSNIKKMLAIKDVYSDSYTDIFGTAASCFEEAGEQFLSALFSNIVADEKNRSTTSSASGPISPEVK